MVSGDLVEKKLHALIKAGGGSAKLKTVQGDMLTVAMHGHALTVTDAKGDVADVTIANVRQSNGVIYVIDKVLLPAS